MCMRHLKLYCMIFTVKDKTCQKVYMQRTLLKYMIMIRAQNNNLVVAADLYFQIIIKISNIILIIYIVCRLWILRKLQLVIFCRTIIFWFRIFNVVLIHLNSCVLKLILLNYMWSTSLLIFHLLNL